MNLLVRALLVLASMLAAKVVVPDAPAFGVVQGMVALVLVTTVIVFFMLFLVSVTMILLSSVTRATWELISISPCPL